MAAPAAPVNNPGTHGKEGIVALKMNAGDAYVAIGNISDWTLNMAKDKVETTSLGDSNKRYVMGLKDLSGSFTAFADRLSDVIFDAADVDTGCFLAFYPYGALSSQAWEGPAHLDASIKGGITSAVTIESTFVANGAWTRTSMVAATGATGVTSPGTFTPPGAMAPANLAAMTGVTASPATAWTTGQYVKLGDGSTAHWDGAAWVAGIAP
jgi:hypothetical protein